MFKKILTTTVLSVSALGVMAANAADVDNAAQLGTSSKSGVYVTGQLGYANTHMGNKTDFTQIGNGIIPNNAKDTNLVNNGLAGRLAIGYQFNQNFAVETGYLQLGQKNVSGAIGNNPIKLQLRQNVIDLVGKGIYPVYDKFNVYAKAGIAYVNSPIDAKETTNGIPVTANLNNAVNIAKHKFAPEVAVGASYDITPNVSVDTSWTHIQTIGKNRPGNIDFIAVGLGYNFG